MKRFFLLLMTAAFLFSVCPPALAGWNQVDVATDGKGIAVYTASRGRKQAGILFNGYSDSISLEPTNGLYSCSLTSDCTVWLDQTKAEKNQPRGEGITWYSNEWDALMPSNIFVAEVIQPDAPLYTSPSHTHLSAKHAVGTLVKVCGEFGNDYYVSYDATMRYSGHIGFMPKAALRKVQDISYIQANDESERWGLSGVREMTVYTDGAPLAVGGSATGYSDMSPAVLNNGDTVTILKMLDNWAQTSGGYFVETRFLTPYADHSVTFATVKSTGVANRLNVRNEASTDAGVIAKLCSGTRVQVPAHTEEWASVYLTGPNGGQSWAGSVQLQYLVFGDAAEKVISGCIRVRTEKALYRTYHLSTAYYRPEESRYSALPAGTEMTVIGVYSGYDISQDDADCFLCLLDDGTAITVVNTGGFLEPLESLGVTAKSSSNVRMRESPSTEARILRTLDKGTKVEVVLRGEGWTIVKYRDQTGYVMSRYLQFP